MQICKVYQMHRKVQTRFVHMLQVMNAQEVRAHCTNLVNLNNFIMHRVSFLPLRRSSCRLLKGDCQTGRTNLISRWLHSTYKIRIHGKFLIDIYRISRSKSTLIVNLEKIVFRELALLVVCTFRVNSLPWSMLPIGERNFILLWGF